MPAPRTTLAALALALLLASPAIAQDEVFIDPDAPATREYSVPLDEARRESGADGGPAAVKPGQRSAERFGAGVEEGGAAAPSGAAGRRPSADDREDDEARGAGGGARAADGGSSATGPRTELPPLAAADRTAGQRSESAGWGTASGVGVLLLVAGLGVGLLVRRRSAPAR